MKPATATGKIYRNATWQDANASSSSRPAPSRPASSTSSASESLADILLTDFASGKMSAVKVPRFLTYLCCVYPQIYIFSFGVKTIETMQTHSFNCGPFSFPTYSV